MPSIVHSLRTRNGRINEFVKDPDHANPTFEASILDFTPIYNIISLKHILFGNFLKLRMKVHLETEIIYTVLKNSVFSTVLE